MLYFLPTIKRLDDLANVYFRAHAFILHFPKKPKTKHNNNVFGHVCTSELTPIELCTGT